MAQRINPIGNEWNPPVASRFGRTPAPPPAVAALSIVKTQAEAELEIDDEQVYTVIVTNVGTVSAAQTLVFDALPDGFTFESCTIAYTGAATGPVVASAAELAAGIAITAFPVGTSVTLTITGSYDEAGEFTNTAIAIPPTGATVEDSVVTVVAEPEPPGLQPLLLYNFEQPNGSFAFVDDVGHSLSNSSSGLGGATGIDTTQAKFGSGSLRLREGTELQLGRSGTISGFNTEFDLGGVSFTYEFWLYVETGTTYVDCGWWGNLSAFNQRTWRMLWLLQGGEPGLEVELFDNNFILDAAVPELQYSTWQHIALCYDHDTTTARVFVDGVLVATGDLSGATYTDTYEPSLIIWGTDGVAYIDCLRVIRDVALYTEAFTPPSSVLTTPTDAQAAPSELAGIRVQLKGLGNSSGGDVVDDTGKIVTLETTGGHLSFFAGDNALTNSDGCIQMQRLSGQTVMGAHFEIQPGEDMDSLAGDDWTQEFFYKMNELNSGSLRFPGPTGSSSPAFITIQVASESVEATINNGISTIVLGTEDALDNVWNHVALVREGGTLNLYVNGLLKDTAAIGFNIPDRPINWPCVTGELFGQGTTPYIRIDGIRSSNFARYSGASYSVPTSY
jgi:uncharacterized repeat protein (TIGR01451 family)